MIAGELDISVGAMVPAGAMMTAVIGGHYGLPIWYGIAATLAFGVVVGLVNGLMVVRTAVPSLIVTLGTLFAVQGILLGMTVLITKSTNVAIKAEGLAKFMFGEFVSIGWHFSARPIAGHCRLVACCSPPAMFSSFTSHATAIGYLPWAATGECAQCRHSHRPHDHHTLCAFRNVGRFCRHVPGHLV